MASAGQGKKELLSIAPLLRYATFSRRSGPFRRDAPFQKPGYGKQVMTTAKSFATVRIGLPLFLLLAAGVFGAATDAHAQANALTWPQFRGPGGQGISTEKGLPTTWGPQENIAWKTALPGAGTSSPIILGQRVYLTCYSGYNVPGRPGGAMEQLKRHLLCLDAGDGKMLWTKDIASELPEQGNIREGHGYASSTPATDGERIYTFFGKSGVFAFDLDGKQLWQADVGTELNGWGSAASPVLSGNLVIINASVESGALVALDKKTGKEVWRARGMRESWNTPILVPTEGGKTELVVAIMGKVLGFDPATGEALWSCATDIPWYMVPSLVANDGIVYCIGGRNGGGALAVRTGGKGDVTQTHRLWTLGKGSNVPSPLYHEGHLYWINDGLPIAYCVEAATGKIVYEQRIDRGDQVYASPILADGKIYYVGRTGRTYVLPARPAFELLATNTVGDRSMYNAGLAAAGGRLYLRSDHFLYCISKK
jgi:outer membrane protein assembly factor BamB